MLTSDVTLQSPFATWMLAVSGWRVFSAVIDAQHSDCRQSKMWQADRLLFACDLAASSVLLLNLNKRLEKVSWVCFFLMVSRHVVISRLPASTFGLFCSWSHSMLFWGPELLLRRKLTPPPFEASVRPVCEFVACTSSNWPCVFYILISHWHTSTMFHPLTCRIEQYIYTVACTVRYWDLLRFVEICSPIRSHHFSQVVRRRGVAREPLWSRGGASASRSPGADCRWKGDWHRNMS
jgi:hypothetical protein